MNVLVTGSSRGIGKALVLAFARAGHAVGIHYQSRQSEAEKVLAEVKDAGGRGEIFRADLSQPGQCRSLVEGAFAKLDGLVNNAGITRDAGLFKLTEADWRDVLDVNLSGPFYCLQAAAKRMRGEKEGFILNVASILGLRGGVGCANYVAAKAGLIGLTKAAALELGRYNIRVNALLPGFHLTEMSQKIPPDAQARTMALHPLGRSTDIDELARLAVRLAESKTVSGQVFNVDNRIV